MREFSVARGSTEISLPHCNQTVFITSWGIEPQTGRASIVLYISGLQAFKPKKTILKQNQTCHFVTENTEFGLGQILLPEVLFSTCI